MRLLFTALSIMFSVSVAPAQSNAKTIIEDVRAHYHTDYSFKSDFSMEIDIPEASKTVMDGTLFLHGDKFKFITDDQEVISDDVNLWYWTKTGGIDEVQISFVEEAEDIISPSDVFGVYLKGFAYTLVSETVQQGKKLALIEMVPEKRDENNPYFKVKVIVNRGNNSLDQLQVYYKDGTVYTFNIKGESKQTFPVEFFGFNATKNPNTEVIDLR